MLERKRMRKSGRELVSGTNIGIKSGGLLGRVIKKVVEKGFR